MIKLEGGFVANLGKVYGLYTLGFLGFVILMGILEAAGVENTIIGWLFVAFTVMIYALIGVLSRTMESDQYYVAGREVPAVYMVWRPLRTGCLVRPLLRWLVVSILRAILIWPFWLAGPAVMCWWLH